MKKNQQPLPVLSSSSEETESSSDGDVKSAAPNKPVAYKLMGSDSDSPIPSKPKKGGSKLTKTKPSNSLASPSKTPTKRKYPDVDGEASKRSKEEKSQGPEDEGKKSNLFQRLWSDEDEIAILKGMLEFKEGNGLSPMTDFVGFNEFIKDSLHADFDRKQVSAKIRRLKKRYENSLSKKNLNPHEQAVFDLSKKIWGNAVSVGDVSNMKTRTISKASAAKDDSAIDLDPPISNEINDEDNSRQFIGKSSISMGLDENLVKVGLNLCSEDKKTEMEAKWKQFYLKESELFLTKMDLAREETKMITEALKSAGK